MPVVMFCLNFGFYLLKAETSEGSEGTEILRGGPQTYVSGAVPSH